MRVDRRILPHTRLGDRQSLVQQDQWAAVDEYVAGLLAHHDAALEAALGASEEAGLPAIQVSPPQGKLLYLLAKSIGASAILEFGTLGAYSTIWLARALPEGGRLITTTLSATGPLPTPKATIRRCRLSAAYTR